MKKLGLVLAGGGGKGAYEIGVWKYLKEIGLDKKISVISGTSVGGLNAALMGTDDYENAECIWKYKINQKAILTPHNKNKKIAAGAATAIAGAVTGFTVSPIGKLAVTALSIANKIRKDGLFSRKGLLEIFNHVKLDKIADSKKSIYVTCTLEKPVVDKVLLGDERERVSFRLNNYNAEGIKKLLLATSAIPGVFRPEIIEGNKYFDGGFKAIFKNGKIISYMDNVPLTPAVDEHCTHVIVVYLEPNPKKAIIRDEYGDMALRENSIEMIEIKPSKDLGGILDGTLNFDREAAQRNIELGYNDTKNKYGKILQSLLKEIPDIHENNQGETERVLKKYIYDMNGKNKEPVYLKEELPSVKDEIQSLIKQSSYKIKFSDVIGYISGKQMIITQNGFLLRNADSFYYILYDEIENISIPVAQIKYGNNICLSGNFSNCSEKNVVINSNLIVPEYNANVFREFLNDLIQCRQKNSTCDKRKETIRKYILEYIQKSSDKLINFTVINDNSTLLKKVEKSLSYCECNLRINDILAYKDISILGNGADFFILTEEGIHYKSTGQDYYYMEYENIKEITNQKKVFILDKRELSSGFREINMHIPKYLFLDYLDDKSTLFDCLEKIRKLFEL